MAAAVEKPADVPVIDRVAIRVVIDSYHHALEPPRTPPRRTLQNEWGLSLHVESARGDETRQVLLDFAYTPEALLNNLLLCGVDVSRLDAIALSHGHFDHFGGMVGFLDANRGKLKPGLPFYLGSEECFCAPEGLSEAKRALTAAVPDDFEHEQAIVYHLKGRGLVVMTSCGHRGIVNSVRRAMQVAGTDKVHAVMGGFHLAPHATDYQRQTLNELKAINPDFLIPMHCSGETFISMVQAEMPERFVRSSTGTRFIFTA